MIVSTRGRYAIRILTELAGSTEYRSLKAVAEEQNIPHKYAENIMTALVKAGFAEGSRGKNGGYRLSRPPEAYTLAEILKVTETSLSASACLGEGQCPRAGDCPTLPVWKALDETVFRFLSQYTLADLLPETENGNRP